MTTQTTSKYLYWTLWLATLLYMLLLALKGGYIAWVGPLIGVFGLLVLPLTLGALRLVQGLSAPMDEAKRMAAYRRARVVLAYSFFCIALAFVLGIATAGGLHPSHANLQLPAVSRIK